MTWPAAGSADGNWSRTAVDLVGGATKPILFAASDGGYRSIYPAFAGFPTESTFARFAPRAVAISFSHAAVAFW